MFDSLCVPSETAASWFGAIATFLAVVLAFWQILSQKKEDQERQVRLQATHISAWIMGYSKEERMKWSIGLSNASLEPVFEVVVTEVAIQGSSIHDASKAPHDYQFRSFYGVLPPGQFNHFINSGGGGMMKRFALEIAFTDSAGNNWVRMGNGKLQKIDQPAVEYYKIHRPIGWQYLQSNT